MVTGSVSVGSLSLHECREMARAIRGAERGRQVLRTLRPRGVSWLLRDRLPLTLLLFLAHRERRLVRWGAAGVAMVDFPLGVREQVRRPDRVTRWLAKLDTYWTVATFAAPAAALMPLAAVVALLGPRNDWFRLVVLLLVLLAMAWIVAVLTIGVLAALVGAWRSVERTPDPRAHAGGSLMSEHWTVSLCHAPDREDTGPLLDGVRARVAELAPGLPDARDRRGTELVLCVLDGISTTAAEDTAA